MQIKQKFTKHIVALTALSVVGAGAGVGALASAQTATDASGAAAAAQQTNEHRGMPGERGGRHGHGQGAHGTVSAISGTTLTITREDGTTYTVEAANAKVSKVVEVSVSDIKVGDRVDAHGSISGTTVTADHIMTGLPEKPADAPKQQ
jgi:hypothetical protein